MPTRETNRHWRIAIMGSLMIAMAGCHKKVENTAAVTTPPSVVETSPAPTAAPALTTSVPISADVKQSLTETDAALKAGAYETAAKNLLSLQQSQKQKPLTAQQAQQAYNQMAQLQSSLGNAIARGDPNAKAVADLLRRSAINR